MNLFKKNPVTHPNPPAQKKEIKSHFRAVEGATVVIFYRGVYYERPLYRDTAGTMFFKHGSGFVRLSSGDHTSLNKCEWRKIYLPKGDPEGYIMGTSKCEIR